MILASRPVGDRFFHRFRTPSSIAQINVPFITESTNPRLDTKEHDSTQTKFNSIYRKKVSYRPYPRPRVYRNRLIFLFPFSFESDVRRPPPALRVAARAALVYRSTSFSSAPRDCTAVLRLALVASCAHIQFFFREVRTRLSPAFSYFTVLTACDTTDSMQFFPCQPLRPPQVLSGFS